jgi:hypothetical protein
MKRRAASRKVNYASIVKINMPALVGGCDFPEAAYRHFKSMTTQSRFNKLLDNDLVDHNCIYSNRTSLHLGCRCRRRIPNSNSCGNKEL